MGITTPLSTNPAMTIGGLTVGVTPMDMAHAYETIAHGGQRVSGSLAEDGAPVGIQEVEAAKGRTLPDGARSDRNRVETKRVLPTSVATTETSMLETVLQYGTGRAAAIGQFAAGKTGTTSNYGDAWFVGWDSKYTVAVWVGYPTKLIPMTTDFNNTPVLGGTFPALIWHDFMTQALQIDKARAEHAAHPNINPAAGGGSTSTSETTSTSPSQGSGSSSGTGTTPAGTGKANGKSTTPGTAGGEAPGGASEHPTATPTPAPAHEAPSAPPSTPSTPATPPATPAPGGGSPTGGVGPAG